MLMTDFVQPLPSNIDIKTHSVIVKKLDEKDEN